jgi:hypothetical protein
MKRDVFSRPPLARMLRLHELLCQGEPVTCKRIAEELEVSPKTIHRDIEFMRDQLSLPIEYQPERHCFVYTGPVDSALFGSTMGAAPPARQGEPAIAFGLALDDEPAGCLAVICERHGLSAECALRAALGETLSDAMRIPRLMEAIVRSARVLAMNGREAA